MISPEQLTAALQRLDPRDWEVLDLSLRRRVPDEALARLFATEPPEVARRRAFAIEHLADELGVQRGEDLGAVLKALLEPATWAQAEREQNEGWEGFSDPDGPPAPAPPVEGEPPRAEEPPPPTVEEPPSSTAEEPPTPTGDESPTPPEPRTEPRTSETARHFRLAPPPELPPLDLEREPEPAASRAPAARQPEVEKEPEPERPSHLAAVPAPADPEIGATPQAEGEPGAEVEPRAEVEPGAEVAPDAEAGPESEAEAERDAEAEPEPEDEAAQEPESAPDPEPEALDPEPAPEPAPAPRPHAPAPPTNGGVPPAPEPVLDMLAERDQERRRQRIRTPLLWALAGGLGAIGLFGAGYVGATLFGDEGGGDRPPSGGEGNDARRFLPNAGGPVAAEPFPSEPRDGSCYPTAAVQREVKLHQRPGSKRTLKVQGRTEWGSERVFSVVKRRGDWLAVLAPELRNDEVGWVRSEGAKLDCVRWSLHVDLSRRRLYVRKDGRTMRKMPVAIGAKGHPTPKGRFAVTDKLEVVDKGSPYGCCVLALTGHQTRLPADWPGGDRLAVHATSDLSSIGKPVSLGCMRSRPGEVEWLIKTVPLGAPIFIKA